VPGWRACPRVLVGLRGVQLAVVFAVDERESAGEMLAAGVEALVEAAFRTDEYDRAEALLQSARVRAGEDGDRATEAAALDRLGMLTHFRALERGSGEADAEEALFRQALAIRRDVGDLPGVAESLFGLGLVHQVLRRDWDAAMPYFWRAMALAEEHGDGLTRSEVHRHVGFFYLVEDVQPEKAVHHLRISLELRQRLGDRRWIPSGTLALGQAELVAGMSLEALHHLRLAITQARQAGVRRHSIEEAEEWLRQAESGGAPISH
jgi:tetratricopeptide (TPR) repeat protein